MRTALGSTKGFTLVEIIVSTAIFAVVATITIGALVTLNNTSREARAMRVILDNANAAVDSIARSARMGVRINCGCDAATMDTGADCPITGTGTTSLCFYGPAGLAGSLSPLKFWYDPATQSVKRRVGGASEEIMTAPEVQVTGLTFYVNGAVQSAVNGNEFQPVITLVMNGIAHVSKQARAFTIQTTISPRTPNDSIVATST